MGPTILELLMASPIDLSFRIGALFLPLVEREKARAMLKQMLGPGAEFRQGQWEAIDLAANQRRRALVVQRTGWGKSIVYFLAAKILRDAGAGPALLISPLLSLMRNQILAAEKLGVRAVTLNSENMRERDHIEARLRADQVDILLVSPERLGHSEFLEKLLPLIQGSIGMFVVDEAHCISDWGHDFRPDYRRIVRLLRLLPPGVPVLCTTATANNRVVNDIESQIPGLTILRGPLVRGSLKLFNISLHDQAERLAWLAHVIPKLPGSGILYTLTIQDSRRVATWLKERGIAARAYHADLEGAERVLAEQDLLENRVKALVATVALGMGFDKPDLGFVVHFQRPGSVVAYYQQVGRAGRAVDLAYGVLLNGTEDDEIQDYFMRTAFPPAHVSDEIVRVLGKSEGLTLDELGAELNHSRSTMEKALRALEVDGAVQHEGRKYLRTANPWKADLARAEKVTEHRRAELAQIQSYVAYAGCLMEFLARALDDSTAAPCGKCMNCTGKTERQQIPADLAQAAADFLRSDALILEPRKYWPEPVLAEIIRTMPEALDTFENGSARSLIPPRLTPEEGRVLCIYGDAGWGQDVAHGKYGTGLFHEKLVEASARLILEKWDPEPRPEWVTTVPSQRHPELIADFAARLASRLEVPFYPVLRKRGLSPAQKEMRNSATQLRNLLKAFQVVDARLNTTAQGTIAASTGNVVQNLSRRVAIALGAKAVLPSGPVLLVDDVVDSRWTLTMAAILLRLNGSGPVFPFALAKASPRGG
jgi:ATP-dependent DNA helicase RecQ